MGIRFLLVFIVVNILAFNLIAKEWYLPGDVSSQQYIRYIDSNTQQTLYKIEMHSDSEMHKLNLKTDYTIKLQDSKNHFFKLCTDSCLQVEIKNDEFEIQPHQTFEVNDATYISVSPFTIERTIDNWFPLIVMLVVWEIIALVITLLIWAGIESLIE